jgi:hypothetical protein
MFWFMGALLLAGMGCIVHRVKVVTVSLTPQWAIVDNISSNPAWRAVALGSLPALGNEELIMPMIAKILVLVDTG